ncbi:MAG: HsdR family type I site-specific deoxyribonuclease, partial [Pseudomonadota bacterium]
ARRLGVFWHTQGSGKSASMVFFTQKVLRKIRGNWTFVIVTDRQELDDQIYKTFVNAGIINEKQSQAESSKHLRSLLQEDHRYVFTLIHKFRTDDGGKHPVLSDRNDIIVVTDEAHRSQYDILAQNMRDALPNAAFIGFTGTPLIKSEQERTREVFGDYVSIYNFRQSIDDGATVPLYYENRIPEVQLTNDTLNDDMERLLDDAMLDDDQEKKLEREFAKQYMVITRNDRLEKIAEDIVAHFMGRGHRGKAMVVALDKVTAVRMYDKVGKHWKCYLENLNAREKIAIGEELAELKEKIAYMQATDMAVVVSQGQNEVDDMLAKGVDILLHRKRMVKEDLDKKFKDPDDPFRIVFVCAMWMTGFDVPSCSTIYLDKPMKNHTLMQTIARANRVFQEKKNGLIVDYIGVFRNLERALAIYAADDGTRTDSPIKDKDELKTLLLMAIEETMAFLNGRKVDLDGIIQTTDVLERTKLKFDAVDTILETEDSKKAYLQLADKVVMLHKSYLPDPMDAKSSERIYLIRKLANQIRGLSPEIDISEVMNRVEKLLDTSIKGYEIHDPKEPWGTNLYDLSKIDFDKLRKQFEKNRKHIEAEKLKTAIEKKIHDLVIVNKTRIDFQEQFKELIDEYNSGAKNIDELFEKLISFARGLNDEEKRHIREGLSDEELTIFDLLTKPEMKLSKTQEKDVKQVCRKLLGKLKTEKFVLDWSKKQQTRASVQLTISELLDELPEVYTKEIYSQKCSLLYQYVYDRY